jgi:hypothetical protein
MKSRLSSCIAFCAVLLGVTSHALAQCTGCCDMSATNYTPLPGQTTTITLTAGVTGCSSHGTGRVSGSIVGSATTNGIPAGAISAVSLLGFSNQYTGTTGSISAAPLRINSLDCKRADRFGGGSSGGGSFGPCPTNSSGDMLRFNFTVPATATPGTIYTFTFNGSVQPISSWSRVGFWHLRWWRANLAAALALSGCDVTITVGGTPSNNSCGNCTNLSPGVTIAGTTVGTATDGSSTCGGTSDVWYCFRPTCPTPITVSTCGSTPSTDTVLSVHTACPGTATNQVNCNDDAAPGSGCPSTLQSSVTFTPTVGQFYRFRVATLGTAGPFVVTMTQAPPVAPTNNPCTGALAVTNGTTPFTTCGATTDGPAGCTADNDVWFVYTATCTGTLTIGTCGSSFNTNMAVYTGACGNLCPLKCNDDNGPACGGINASTSLYTTAGTAYRIRVGGNAPGVVGSGTLTISCIAGPPPNDNCANAPAAGLGTIGGTTIGATPTPGLVGMCGSSGASPDVFYSFNTCVAAPVTITTCGTAPCLGTAAYDTVLSVHRDCPTATSNEVVVCNDDANTGPCSGTSRSIVTFLPEPCRNYIIRVSGFSGDVGNFALNISQPSTPPTNNACSNSTIVQSGSSTLFTNCLSTTDGPSTCVPSGNDIWFRWTSPCSGPATITTCGSRFDTVLSVYPGSPCPPSTASQIVCNDDVGTSPCGHLSSRVVVNASQGVTYLIRVSGYDYGSGGSVGCGRLNISGPGPTAPTCPPLPDPNPLNCQISFQPAQYFQIVGTSTGASWKWRLQQDCCFNIENCNVPGLPAGSSEAALAAAFVASLRAQCGPLGSRMIISDQGGGMFSIKTTRCRLSISPCTYNTLPIKLYIGDANDDCNALHPVLGINLYTTGPANFNPGIAEIETSGVDCNNNGIDDAVDIVQETSTDVNSDGIPDECQTGNVCDSIDFNNDGLFPDTADIDDFLSVFSGGPCSNDPNCNDIDFNNDALFPDTGDIDSYLSVFSGGPCL